MIGHISIKTKMGWITAYEEKGEIFKIKFGKLRKYSKSKILLLFKKKTIGIWKIFYLAGLFIDTKKML